MTWPVATLNQPGAGVDYSFFAAMYMAAHAGLHFGTQIVSTYGPLGFVRWLGVYYTWPTLVSITYLLVQQFVLCFTLLWPLRRTFNTPVAFLITLLVAGAISTAGPHEVSLVIAFVWSIEALRTDANPLVARYFPVAAGLLAGIEVLVKLNTGSAVALVLVIACVAVKGDGWRRLGIFAGSFLVTAMVGWFATGQSLGNVVDFVSATRQMVSGWSTVMMASDPNAHWELWAALATAVLVLYLGLDATKLQPRRTRIAMTVIWVIIAYAVFKEGFVRNDSGHTSIFFATMLGAAAAFAWQRSQAKTILLSIGVLAMAFFAVSHNDPFTPISDISSNLSSIPTTARVIFSSHERDKLEAQSRRSLKAQYHIDPGMLALVGNRSVQEIPSEASVIWAYQLHWKPVPVFEPVLAYTSALDNKNRDALIHDGSDRIIRDADPAIDDRNVALDTPAMNVAMFCHYAQLAADGRWQVLGRVPNRCGAPTLLRKIGARWGDTVQVPPPRVSGDAVLVKISGASPSGLYALRTLLYRAHERNIVLDRKSLYRLVPDTVGDGILISVPHGSDYSPPFALAPNSRSISLVSSPSQLFAVELSRALGAPPAAPHPGGLTYSFYEMPIA